MLEDTTYVSFQKSRLFGTSYILMFFKKRSFHFLKNKEISFRIHLIETVEITLIEQHEPIKFSSVMSIIFRYQIFIYQFSEYQIKPIKFYNVPHFGTFNTAPNFKDLSDEIWTFLNIPIKLPKPDLN